MARIMAKDRAAMQTGEAEDDFGQDDDDNDEIEGSGAQSYYTVVFDNMTICNSCKSS